MIHPIRLTWNLRIHPWKGKSSSKPSFSGSMLIFQGFKAYFQGLLFFLSSQLDEQKIRQVKEPMANGTFNVKGVLEQLPGRLSHVVSRQKHIKTRDMYTVLGMKPAYILYFHPYPNKNDPILTCAYFFELGWFNHQAATCIWVFPKIGVPQNGW